MLDNKTGFPEEGELVQCTITSVQSHSIFVKIDDYGINGMIHISEVAPGRIRNIRDYVLEGKNVICKVLRVNQERGHVDLSLRRVSENQRRAKVNEMKKEKLANKLVEVVAENLNIPNKQLNASISETVHEHFYLLFECFTEIARGTFLITDLKLPKNVADELKKVILDRLKPEIIISRGKLLLSTYDPAGIDIIKEALKQAVDAGAEVKYLGGGTYSLICKAANYKNAEIALNKAADTAITFINSKHGNGELIEVKT